MSRAKSMVALCSLLLAACSATAPVGSVSPSVDSATASPSPSPSHSATSGLPTTSGPTSTPVATDDPTTLRYVALGDSVMFNHPADCPGCIGSVDLYARALEEATGWTVSFDNQTRHTGLQTQGLITILTDEEGLRAKLAEADIISVSIGYNDLSWTEIHDVCDIAEPYPAPDISDYTDACLQTWAASYGELFEAAMSEITALRDGQPPLLIATNIYDSYLGWPDLPEPEEPYLPVIRRVIESQNREICRIAREHGALCADLHSAFNGGRHDRPAEDLLAEDYTHPSQSGNQLIADTLIGVGLGPFEP